MFGVKEAADFGKTLVKAGAIKPAIGLFLVILGLYAITIIIGLSPSQLVFWPPFILAVVLPITGLWAIVAFIRAPDVKPPRVHQSADK